MDISSELGWVREMSESGRDVVFVSHANPEDNEFARWLSLRLVNEGYKVWSDITRLIGGERWWGEIEDAIREATVKFLFVLSTASNRKDGTLKELHLADTVRKVQSIRDFIIPLRIDDIAYHDTNVLIHGLNVISFSESWADGLNRVLKKLSRDEVPRDASICNASVASSWWQSHWDGHDIIRDGVEDYLSNWFPISSLPEAVNIHRLGRVAWQRDPEGFPAYERGEYVISFASAEDLGITDVRTTVASTSEVLTREATWLPLDNGSIRNAIVNILRQGWEDMMSGVGLPYFTMANERKCHFFTEAILGDKKLISFDIADDIRGKRSLVGVSKKKFWHFAVSAYPQLEPIRAFILRYHVLFSSDGARIWESARARHRARRSACKDWWNDVWRDRLLLSLHWTAQKGGTEDRIIIDLSPERGIEIAIMPVQFVSPIAYDDAKVKMTPVLDEEVDYLDHAEDRET